MKKKGQLKIITSSFLLFAAAPLFAGSGAFIAQANMPLAFEQNQGQTNPQIKFLSRGAAGVLMLSQDEITLRAPGKGSQLRIKLIGTADTEVIEGSGESSGTINYLRGNEPSKWIADVPSYTQAIYKNLYAGIDLKVYGNNGQFESDFVLRQGANPSAIAFNVDGNLELRPDGSIAVQSDGSQFQLHQPFVYQIDSDGNRVSVACRYTVDHHKVGFALGGYDHARSLVIDPIISYSTIFGGSNDDSILSIKGDLLGNIYVAGQTDSLDFPTANPEQSSLGDAKGANQGDCFVSKFDPTGQHLLYSTYLGGSNLDRCTSIAVNILGEAFVGGITYSSNFPTVKALQANLQGGPGAVNGFVAHLCATGSKLVFSTYLGGGGEFLTGIALDALSNVYVAGLTNATNFPVTKTAFQSQCGSGAAICYNNGFISKISPDGSQLLYSTYLGGSTNYDSITGIAVDLTGSIYVTGEAHSSNFPTKNPLQATIAGPSNAFVTKFSPNGTSLVYSTYIGGNGFDSARSIDIDVLGNAYVTGATTSTNFPTVNAFQPKYASAGTMPSYLYSNIFVLKLNAKGSALNYSTYVGGSSYDYPFHIAVDLSGNASVIGLTNSTDFPVKSPIQATYGGGILDAFVVNLSTTGALNYSTYLGGTGDDYGYAAYVDLLGCLWVGGTTSSPNYPSVSPYQAKSTGGFDAFLTRINH